MSVASPPARSARRLWLGLAAVLLVLPLAMYALLFWRWHAIVPEITFDALDELNAPALAVPEGERAWPMLRAAWAAADLSGLAVPEEAEDGGGWEVASATPAAAGGFGGFGGPSGFGGERESIDPTVWLEAHRGLVEAGRQAAAFEGFGWLASRGALPAEEVAALFGGVDPRAGVAPADDLAGRLVAESAILVELPTIGLLRDHGRVLALDARVAAEAGDGERWLADLAGIKAIAGFAAETPTVINGLVSLSLLQLHNGTVEQSLARNTGGLDGATLAEIADRLAAQEIRGVLRVDGERLAIRDTLQRTHGPGPGGRLTATGAEVLRQFGGGGPGSGNAWLQRGRRLIEPLRLLRLASRDEELAVYDAYLDTLAARFRLPARDATGPSLAVQAGFEEPGFAARHPTLAAMAPSLDHLLGTQELALGRQDAARLAVALARFRLARDAWPAGLDELVPAFLPELPADRITGGPLHYAVRGGTPVVWSVGADRDDDRGVPTPGGESDSALWGNAAASPADGDWILLGTVDPAGG